MKKMGMFLLKVLVFVQLSVDICDGVIIKYTAEYFSNTTLFCDIRALGLPYTGGLRYWILPNDSVIQPNYITTAKYEMGAHPDYNLTINYVADEDYGWYHCIILWDNTIYLVHTIRVGLYPNYDDIWTKYGKAAFIGGVSAGSVVVLIILVCVVNHRRHRVPDESKRREEEKKAVYELDKTVQIFDDVIAGNGAVAVGMRDEQLDEYDAADGIDKVAVIETISVQSSGFYDNKTFDIENESIVPFPESDIDNATNIKREDGDELL